MKHVIIGTGPAGIIAAETLRKIDPTALITVIGDEQEQPYSRMALPYLLSGRIPEQGTWLRKSPHHFEKLNIDLVCDRVTAIDPDTHSIRLQTGASLDYERLLIATGARPVRPPIEGMSLTGVHNCWTLADARRIAALAQAGSKVVLMGAGFIGCIILEALAERGVQLVVVEMDNRMVPRMMDDKAGQLLKKWCEIREVGVHTGMRVTAIQHISGVDPLAVHLDNGQVITADLVIAATGVKPNIELPAVSGIATDFGILVDRHLQTNRHNVFAAGDVAQGLDFSTGGYSVQAIQPTAADHGRIAARNMAGDPVVHEGCINMNILDTMGLISSSFGLWMGVDGGDSAELYDAARYRYLKLQFAGDVVVGALALGLPEHIGALRGLIQMRVRLGRWKAKLMRDPTQFMAAYIACTQATVTNAPLQ